MKRHHSQIFRVNVALVAIVITYFIGIFYQKKTVTPVSTTSILSSSRNHSHHNRSVIATAHAKSARNPFIPSAPTSAFLPPRITASFPAPLDHPSDEELHFFPGAHVVESQEIAGSKPHQNTRLRILQTDFKYPYIRTEEIIDTTSGCIITRQEMAADHLLVTLADEQEPMTLLKNLGSLAISIKQVTPDAPLYQVNLSSSSLESLPQALDQLATSEMIASMSGPDFICKATTIPNINSFYENWNSWWSWKFDQPTIQNTSFPTTKKNQLNNSAPIVAVIASGIRYTHHNLAPNMWCIPSPTYGDTYGWNAYDNNGNPMDDDGHGTHCEGIIGGTSDNYFRVVGIAPHVQLMACKYLNTDGVGISSDAIQCIDYARRHGAQILNNSWCSEGGFDFSLLSAIFRARLAGIIFVTAAGNESVNSDLCPIYPACYGLDNIVAVAATTWDDKLAPFSNYGSKTIHLAAPGVDITSTYADSNTSYAICSGTSMAAPFVSGTFALLKDQFPDQPYDTLITTLLNTTDKIPSLEGKIIAGRLNIDR